MKHVFEISGGRFPRLPFSCLIGLAMAGLATVPLCPAASDVTLSTATTAGGAFTGTNPQIFTPVAAAAVANITTFRTSLNGGNAVTIDTASAAAGNGDLTLTSPLAKTAGASSTLTLNAVRDLDINGVVSAAGGPLPLVLTAGRNMTNSTALTTNNGTFTLSPTGIFTVGANLTAGTGQILLQSGIMDSSAARTLTASAVQVAAPASMRLLGTIAGPLTVAGGLSPGAGSGTGTLQVNGSLTLQSTATTALDLGGTSQGSTYDRISATGTVNVAGALQVNLVNNFHDTITSSTVFNVLSGSSITGTFTGQANGSRVTLPNDHGSLRVNYTATAVTLDNWQPVITDLTWDPGTAEAGSAVFSNTNTRSGRHYFRVLTQGTDIGAWRSRLTVLSGEARMFLQKTTLPTLSGGTYSSDQAGSDGLMLRDDQFAAGETWYLLVAANAGSQWSLFSGRAYVHDLGPLPFTDANSNAQYDIGEAVTAQNAPATIMPAEGIRFYKSTVPTGTPAWSLWLLGSTREIALRTAKVPFPSSTSYYTRKQAGQMLVVPTVLGTGSNAYFLSVSAPQGESIGLDSRIQTVTDLPFNSTVSAVNVTAAPYRVYRTQVPVDQLAWDVSTTAVSGNPNVCVRKNNVPAEFDNEAFSEAPGSTTDSITLVPNYLTDGTWFITVYGTGSYAFDLKSSDPDISLIAFTDLKTNDQPNRAGWVFYALTDIPPQVGSLGWELLLSNPEAGRQIALRRNKVPSRWQYRSNGSASISDTGTTHMDYSGSSGFLQRPGHQADVWYVGIFTPQQALGAFTLDTRPIVPAAVAFDGSNTVVDGQQAGRWIFHRITVPAGVQGWDVRVKNFTGIPQMVVRRDQLPYTIGTGPTTGPDSWDFTNSPPSSRAAWPSGNFWQGHLDWTGRSFDGPNVAVGWRLVMGMGRPLEPGTYYVGIYSQGSAAASYTLESRGIGAGQSIAVTDLAYAAGSSVTVTGLPPREAAYYKVTVPANTPSWEFSLTPTAGEMLLAARRGTLPDFYAGNFGTLQNLGATTGRQVKMQKPGPERFTLLPAHDQDYIVAGDYYLAVVGEGLNPTSNTNGTGTSSGTLINHGPLSITDLGAASPAGINQPVTLGSAQIKAFSFTVPAGTASLEIRLENRIGNPGMSLVAGTRLAQGYEEGGYGDDYGHSDGQRATFIDDNLITMANPAPGPYSLTLRAAYQDSTSSYLPASGDLVIITKQRLALNFDQSLNTNGVSHTDSRQILDTERVFYEVPVPTTLAGQPVLGWILHSSIQQGNASIRVYKTWGDSSTGIAIGSRSAVMVPPFLTLGDTWFVEVQGIGLTNYTLTSSPIMLERPAWLMPAGHNSTFGDTGTDVGGTPLPGDRGVDLGQDDWHFYAIGVPQGNAGLLRTELQAINGNPDLYIREDGVPTTDHDSDGGASGGYTLVDRRLNQTASEYGNWVPLDGRTGKQLRPGRWYLGVKATGGTNCRYRLLISTGQVTDLAVNGGTAANQILVGRDWRYYRFTVPADAPGSWNLTFSQEVGDVVMWLRDGLPPGHNAYPTYDNTFSYVESWYSDGKNQGPYSRSGHNAAGTHAFATPPLRPGHIYYAGFRANNDASFSFSSAVSGATIGNLPVLDFYSGTINTTLAAGETRIYQTPVPPEATRLKWTSTHAGTVQFRQEQGTLPGTTGNQHWTSGTTANFTRNQAISGTWPWQPDQTYYLRVTNTAATPATVVLTMNGKNAQTEDEDTDGMADAWEILHFGNTTSQPAAGDADGDGVSNGVEFADGTLPNNATSAKYTLTLVSPHGTVVMAPIAPKYDRGTTVTLTHTAEAGYTFGGWQRLSNQWDDFATRITGSVVIPADGTYTFGVNSDDGSRLMVNNIAVITDDTTHGVTDKFGQITLTAGIYPLELRSFDNINAEALELFAAPGSLTSFNSTFKLVGDTANGGLAVQTTAGGTTVPGLTVQQVAAAGAGTIINLVRMDELLAGTRLKRAEASRIAQTVNYLGGASLEGRFPGNALFPLQDPETANPLVLTMLANTSLATLNTIPLGQAVDAPALTWTTGGSGSWSGQFTTVHDGTDAAQSGSIGNSQESWMETFVAGPGTLTFWWKVSSQANGDYLEFLIDGTLQTGRISGTVDWQQKTYPITAGSHRLRWKYIKNSSTVAGSDAGLVDEVVWTPASGYSAWAASAGFTPAEQANPAISGPDADPDKDGVSNALEYAFGSPPLNGGDNTPTVLISDSGSNLAVEFRLPEPVPAGITYIVETSEAIGAGTWSAIATRSPSGVWTGPATVSTGPPESNTRPVSIEQTLASPPVRHFLRIRVTGY